MKKASKVSFGRIKMDSLLLSSFVSIGVAVLMIMSDTLVVGNILGENALAGVSLITPLYSVANFIAGLIGVGTSSLFLKYMGAFKKDKATEINSVATILSVIAGVVMMILMIAGENLFFSTMDITPAVLEPAKEYYRYEIYLILLTPYNYLLNCMVYADGDESISTIASVSQVVGNIGVSILLTLKMGTAGTSLGSVIGTVIATAILALHYFKKTNALHFKWVFNFKDIPDMIRYSIVDSEAYLCLGLMIFIMNMFITSRFGEQYIPVLTLITSLLELSLVFDGVGQALNPLAWVYLAENNKTEEKKLAGHGMKISIICGITLAAILFAFAKYIPMLYNITNPEVNDICVKSIRLFVPAFIPISVIYLLSSQFVLLDKIVLASVLTCYMDLIGPVVFGILLGSLFGIYGIATAFIVGMLVFVAGLALYLILRYGGDMFPFLIGRDDGNGITVSAMLDINGIIRLRTEVSKWLENKDVSMKIKNRIALVIEEIFALIADKNPDKEIIGECSVFIQKDKVILITRDSGVIFDITDNDSALSDLRAFVVSNFMDMQKDRKNLTTTGFNRNILSFDR